MPDNVSISINGQSRVPPGFRFHPTEEELLQYYLRKKSRSETIDLDVIKEIDLNKLEPWDIKEKCRIGGSTLQNDWYFFSHKDKKYPTGSRTNRATIAGFWKATGRDKVIYSCAAARIGMRKTLVFYTGRAPLGLKSDWIMHEYRLGDDDNNEEGWVVCKIFRKRQSRKKSQDEGTTVVTSNLIDCSQIRIDNPADKPRGMYDDQISGVGQDDGTLEQIFQHIRPKQSAADIAISEEEEDDAHVPNTTNNILAGKLVSTCPDDIVHSQYNDNECWTTVEQLSFHHPPPSLENQINADMHMINSDLGFYPQVDTGLNGTGCPMQNMIYNSGDGGILSDSTTIDHHQLMIAQLNSAHNQPLEAAAFNMAAADLELYDSIIPSYYDYYI